MITKKANKDKIYEEFNKFEHRGKPTTEPVKQRDIYKLVSKYTDYKGATRQVLLKIIEETVFSAWYYTFKSQQEIADEIGINRRTVIRAEKILLEDGWIRITKSTRKSRCNVTDFNVERAMALGKKGTESQTKCHTKSRANVTKCHTYYKEESNNSSKEELTVPQKFAAVRKLKRNITSLFRTWKEACAKLPAEEQRKITIGSRDLYKFRRFFHKKEKNGYVDIVDKWHGTTEELHQFIVWCILHWQYLKYRMDWAKHMPSFPDIGWFISNVDKFHDIWLDNCGDESDENVILLKEKAHIREMKDKYRQILKDKE